MRIDVSEHIPVLAEESIQALSIKPEGTYIDATFGKGGHSALILDKLTSGQLIAFDQDKHAIEYGKKHYSGIKLIHANFSEMDDRLSKMNLVGEIDGVLMDIGVSSPQLDEADRGFSFMRDGPLDMRMNQDAKLRAYEYLQAVTESELERVLSEYGEERYAKRIAKAIVQARSDYRLKDSTLSLVEIVMKSGIRYEKNKHPATRTFQAIRIAVNAEIDVLALGLEAAFRCLKVGGRLAVISFHGLEHRVVKQFIRKYKGKEGSLKFVEKIGVGYFERKENRRSRSAYLRVMEKLR